MLFEPAPAFLGPRMPEARIVFVAAQTEAVPAMLVNMHFKRHASPMQRGGKIKAVFHRHGAIFRGVKQETRRRSLGHVALVGKLVNQLLGRICPEQISARASVGHRAHGDDRVTKHPQIGPAAKTVNGIGRGGVAGIKMCQQC